MILTSEEYERIMCGTGASEIPFDAPQGHLQEWGGTRVVNKRKEPYDVYIGRGSKWGNPFSHKEGIPGTTLVASREESIARYEEYIRGQRELIAAVPELQGKRLGCFCAPQPCHGDVLVRLVSEIITL